ncbi:MFS general substrate transporter [Penicillium malachiteum]|uniref:MFS general substrate transporter n=1 Tax=Penicillium malachiteum TaxID=1324776 RepID=UPI0025487836|nr:MFS general substrate transporter [Penicillium malachiteum]KAJ5726256.1 MFS general substrate transporter [Penicillium malachiteum]
MEEHADAINLESVPRTEINVLRDAEGLKPSNNSRQFHHSVGNQDEVELQYLTGVKLTLVILAVIAIALLVMLDMSIVATYTYMAFIALFEMGSLICAVATSSNMFIVGRAVAGMGSAGVANGALTILCAAVPLVKRPLYFGIVGSCGQIGVVASPLLGGALTEYATWRWCFYINLPIGVLAVFALLFVSFPENSLNGPEPQPQIKATSLFSELDLTGFLLLAQTLVMFLLALEWGGLAYSWSSAMVLGLFCGSAGSFALFLAWEYRKGEKAMIPLEMIKKRVVYCSSLTSFFLYANSMITSYYLAIYFQGVRGKSPMFSGLYMLPGVIAQMASGFLSGWAVTRIGYYLPPAVLGTILCAIGAGLLSMLTPHIGFGAWVGFQVLAGMGRGFALQNPLIAVQNNLPPSKIAISMAFLYSCQTFGGALWLSFASTLFNNGLTSLLPTYAPGVSASTVISAGVSGIRSVVPEASVDGVIMAYSKAVQHVFYMVSGTATAAFIFSWGLGWKSVKQRTA